MNGEKHLYMIQNGVITHKISGEINIDPVLEEIRRLSSEYIDAILRNFESYNNVGFERCDGQLDNSEDDIFTYIFARELDVGMIIPEPKITLN